MLLPELLLLLLLPLLLLLLPPLLLLLLLLLLLVCCCRLQCRCCAAAPAAPAAAAAAARVGGCWRAARLTHRAAGRTVQFWQAQSKGRFSAHKGRARGLPGHRARRSSRPGRRGTAASRNESNLSPSIQLHLAEAHKLASCSKAEAGTAPASSRPRRCGTAASRNESNPWLALDPTPSRRGAQVGKLLRCEIAGVLDRLVVGD